MMKIDEIWQRLEKEVKPIGKRILYLRYSPEILSDVYVALTIPEGSRCIAVSISEKSKESLSSLKGYSDLLFNVIENTPGSKAYYFMIILSDLRSKDVFSVLSSDLITSCCELKNEGEVVDIILTRLAKWKGMFEKVWSDGLTPEEQRGLYSEIMLFKLMLENGQRVEYCYSVWNDPPRALHDFSTDTSAIEVKSTVKPSKTSIKISSASQLDTLLVSHLVLYHVVLTYDDANGKSLPELIDEIVRTYFKDSGSISKFIVKLAMLGYHDRHKDKYLNHRMIVSDARFYKVSDDFPRIEGSSLSHGIDQVHYSIKSPLESKWEINETEAIQYIAEK